MTGTVLVRLKKDWFDGQSLYEVRHNPHEFPAEWADEPKQRDDETDEDFEKRKAASKYDVLPSTVEIVKAGKTVAIKRDTANGSQVVTTEAVEGDVESVGGALNEKGLEEPSQSLGEASAAAEELGVEQVGGKPRESNPAGGQPGAKKLK